MDTPTKEQLMGAYADAAQYVDQIMKGEQTPAEVLAIPEDEMETFFKEAQTALQLEDYQKAEEMFNALVIMNNKDMRSILGLAGALEGQEKFDFAMLVYFMIIAGVPLDPVAPFRAGVCLLHLGREPEAVKCFELAADCKDEIKDTNKMIYVEKAKGMLKSLARK